MIKVVGWGVGKMGRGILDMLMKKQGIEVVGAIGRTTGVGKDLGELLGFDSPVGIKVDNDAEKVLSSARPDVVILSISSYVRGVADEIELCARYGADVITIAEEMAYPFRTEPELSKKIDSMAKDHGITVLGTGVNPGFVLDSLIAALTYGTRSVRQIKARRVNDLSPYGKTVMEEQGVGLSMEAFIEGVKDGQIHGHIGFLQSIPMIADALGLEYDEIVETREPIMSTVERKTDLVDIKPGMTAGCSHSAVAYRNGVPVITLEHPQQVRPELEGIETGDFIDIYGDPDLHVVIRPETPGGIGTIASAVNIIPQVLSSPPGLLTMMDMTIPHCIMDDFRNHIGKGGNIREGSKGDMGQDT
ncbi:2,4-diaminopentanoate dehydrogenase [Youngiibacter multivorans]|uniref:4-hydroxy-tetrahydrodipicolinate reductase n=1 Tax=Youngiibacter multivorans TaxID=937251 RepID=A0ABS4G2S7_9CLOT|nr:2,4-diaminopentanoate dehydrogenase [Youngiibacter multivorans]MBP1918848.1 4-hydroxy-tetrahydrodipicolinate reductase [Youngiibacter multivorans]